MCLDHVSDRITVYTTQQALFIIPNQVDSNFAIQPN